MYLNLNEINQPFFLVDSAFERRLELYAQRLGATLELHFCQMRNRWCVLEAARDNSGKGKLLVVAENTATKEPMPLGDWVFDVLNEMHSEWKDCAQDPGRWHDKRVQQVESYKAKQNASIRDDARHRIVDDINVWRRGLRELTNRAVK